MAAWRREVIARYGHQCLAEENGPCYGPIEAHHLRHRSQGGRDVPENGIPLCQRHHDYLHARLIKIDPGWLFGDALEHLAEDGWVWWDSDGQPQGPGWRLFLPQKKPEPGY